jgi:hypothetical protein
MYKIRPFKVEL